jgi:hypothetical protein
MSEIAPVDPRPDLWEDPHDDDFEDEPAGSASTPTLPETPAAKTPVPPRAPSGMPRDSWFEDAPTEPMLPAAEPWELAEEAGDDQPRELGIAIPEETPW